MKKELDQLASRLKDGSRLVTRKNDEVLVSHKFTPDGQVLEESNFIPRRDLSRLSLNHLKFLVLWSESNFDEEKTQKESGLSDVQVKALFKKLSYFKHEDAWIKAAVVKATPGFVLAQDVRNVYDGGSLSDSSHKSLERIAKMTGGLHPAQINIQNNVFQMPSMTPEEAQKLKEIGDSWQEGELVVNA